MAKTKVELLLEMKDRLTKGMGRARASVNQNTADMRDKVRRLKQSFVSSFAEMRAQVPLFDKAMRMLTSPITLVVGAFAAIGMAIRKARELSNECTEAYKIQAAAETRLATVMRQRMGATNEEIESIKKLAQQQQRLGIIGDEVQLAGAQQVATFLKNKSSIETLLPAMNNLVAQQKGYAATAEDATNIANLMGKVMQGQTSALSRVGISFSEAEAKALKYGNEAQRAAVLAQIITNNVGQMNEAMAATPEGRLKQYENNLGDLKERAGAMFIAIQSAWLPVQEAIMNGWSRVVGFFERNKERITAVVNTIGNTIALAIRGTFNLLKTLKDGFSFIYEWREVILGVAAAFALLNIKVIATTIATKMLSIASAVMTAAQWLLNVAMTANPIGIIIVLIGALIGIIITLCRRYEGWGTLFSAVGKTIVVGFKQFVATWKDIFDELWTNVQIFWVKIKGFGEYIGELFSNIGKAMKEALKGNFAEAKEILKQDIKTKASVEVEQLQNARDSRREEYKNNSIVNAAEVAAAWKAVNITKKESDDTAAETNELYYGSDTEDNYGSSDIPTSTDSVVGATGQVRNITVNIDSFIKGGVNAGNTEGLNGLNADELDAWFQDRLLRMLRNYEMSR